MSAEHLYDLPNELLVPMINDLSTPDFLSLRQTCKTLWNLTHDAVFWSKRVHYRHPRKLICQFLQNKSLTWQQQTRLDRLFQHRLYRGTPNEWKQYWRRCEHQFNLNASLIHAARTGPVKLVTCLILRGANQLKRALYAEMSGFKTIWDWMDVSGINKLILPIPRGFNLLMPDTSIQSQDLLMMLITVSMPPVKLVISTLS